MEIKFQATQEMRNEMIRLYTEHFGEIFDKPVFRLNASKTEDGLTYSFFDIDNDELTVNDVGLGFLEIDFVVDRALLSAFDNVKLDFKDGKFYFSKTNE